MTKENVKISVIVPVRNEERNIAALLDCLLKQTFQELEIIVVDDLSQDSTVEIVNQYSNKDNKIKLVTVSQKPENWVGKTYALYIGQQYAFSDIILFIDADVRLTNNTLEKSYALFRDDKLDVLTYAAYQDCKTIYEYAVQPMVFMLLNAMYPLQEVSKSESDKAACNGIFIMIKKEVYAEIGTHEAVKNQVLEDVELAKLIKKAGYRLRFEFAPDLISVRMYHSLLELVEGWSKNFFALINKSISGLLLLIAFLLMIFPVPFILSLLDYKMILVSGVYISIIFLFLAYVYFKMKYNPLVAVYYPLGACLLIYIILNSAYLYMYKGTVKWKTRQYKVN